MRKLLLLVAVFGLAVLLFLLPLSAVAQTKTSGVLAGEYALPSAK